MPLNSLNTHFNLLSYILTQFYIYVLNLPTTDPKINEKVSANHNNHFNNLGQSYL